MDEKEAEARPIVGTIFLVYLAAAASNLCVLLLFQLGTN